MNCSARTLATARSTARAGLTRRAVVVDLGHDAAPDRVAPSADQAVAGGCGDFGVSSTSIAIVPPSARTARSARCRPRRAVGQLSDFGAGDRAPLDLLGQDQLALGEDAVVAVVAAEQLRGGGAAQPVIDRRRA